MKKSAVLFLTFIFVFLFRNDAFSCTVFNASDENGTLVGNNEDGINTDAKVWFLPAGNGNHGVVLFGFDDAWIQGGMNDQGLFLDWATEEYEPIGFLSAKTVHKGNYNILYEGNLNEKILKSCSTVQEALAMYKKYDEFAFQNAHVMIVDKSGASVIVEPYNEKLVTIAKETDYQFMTNFNITSSKLRGYSCSRYSMLEKLFKANRDVTIDHFRTLLSDVSQDITVYSNIYDLKKGDIYLYYLHDFNHGIKFNLQSELSKGKHLYDLKTLFHISRPDYGNGTVNNRNWFSEKGYFKYLVTSYYLAIFLLCPAVYIICSVLRKRQRIQIYRQIPDGIRLIAAAIPCATGLLCFLLFSGVIRYGFFIRYRFTFYQSVLLYFPLCIIILTVLQLLFSTWCWRKKIGSTLIRRCYAIITACFVATSLSVQFWCWHLL